MTTDYTQERISKTDKKPLKAMVTGGGGFLGYAIIKELIKRGDIVRSFSRNHYPKLEKLNVEQIKGDLADKRLVAEATQGVDVVFHVAAKTGHWGDYKDYYNTNVVGTENIVDACKENEIDRLVFTSSPSVVFTGKHIEDADESLPYATTYTAPYPKTKALAEQVVANGTGIDLKTVILRPHIVIGPGDPHIIPGAIERAKNLRCIGDGKSMSDITYIDDAAHAHILAADCLARNPELSGNIYFISQGEPVNIWDMINTWYAAAKLAPISKSISYRMATWLAALSETIYNALPLKSEPRLTRFVVDGLGTTHYFNISAAKKDLGYQPSLTIEEINKRICKWIEKTFA